MVGVRRALLVVNPAARLAVARLPIAQKAFRRAGVECEPMLTTHPGHATVVAAEHGARFDAVFTLGGDGTAMEVVGALVGTGIPVGILPGGTGNLVARALGTPLNVARAVPALITGSSREIDLGKLSDGRYFAFAAGIGIDATMVATTTAEAKRRYGVAAYVGTAIRASLALEQFTLRATIDGVIHVLPATAVLLANFGAVLQGLFTLGPAISPYDGMLDLCVFSPADVRDAVSVGWRIMRKDFAPHPSMHFFKGRTFHLETEPSRPMQADGELLGTTPLGASIAPLAACVLTAAPTRG
ncbi:MAG: diacylglycerol kinase family protein [Gemmatimonadaceae bacterium]